jgi:hypothetical protein
MSLLLEALKKAEKAKEEAERRAREQAAGASAVAGLRLEELAEAEKPVLTRAELPHISPSLEILTEDLGPKQPQRRETSGPAVPAPEPAHAPAPSEPRGAAERDMARKTFEAKLSEPPDPRLPFRIALGVLGLAGIGIVAYFWYQLRPPPALFNANARAAEVAPAGAGPAGAASPRTAA